MLKGTKSKFSNFKFKWQCIAYGENLPTNLLFSEGFLIVMKYKNNPILIDMTKYKHVYQATMAKLT